MASDAQSPARACKNRFITPDSALTYAQRLKFHSGPQPISSGMLRARGLHDVCGVVRSIIAGRGRYELKGLLDISGNQVDMSAFAGRVSLVVNVASA
eukprot:COSAG02_NODE_1379_length_12986_cov_20.681928_9_plen_97_part_00